MSCNISAFKFLGVGVINPQSMLDRYEKEIFLLDTTGAWEEPMTTLKGMLAIIHTIVEDLAFSLIRLVACICS